MVRAANWLPLKTKSSTAATIAYDAGSTWG